jgi:hypothetical protein
MSRVLNWSFLKRPNQPAYMAPGKTFKVFTSGLGEAAFTELMNLIWEYQQHTFLVIDTDPDVFWNIPPNVIPLLHCDDPTGLAGRETYFKEVVAGRQSGLYLYFNKGNLKPSLKWDVLVLGGYHYDPMVRCRRWAESARVPCYVESFKFGSPIPVELDCRELPVFTALDVKLFLYSFREAYYELCRSSFPEVI